MDQHVSQRLPVHALNRVVVFHCVAYWKQPFAWDREAAQAAAPARVFCASLADVFDQEVQDELAEGDAVSNVALNVGYTDVSSFIAVFKAALGQTPAKYFRQR